jgi:hypothetical protein
MQVTQNEYTLTISEAAAMLGGTEKAVERLIFTARLDAVRVKGEHGHEFRIRPDDILAQKSDLAQRVADFDGDRSARTGGEAVTSTSEPEESAAPKAKKRASPTTKKSASSPAKKRAPRKADPEVAVTEAETETSTAWTVSMPAQSATPPPFSAKPIRETVPAEDTPAPVPLFSHEAVHVEVADLTAPEETEEPLPALDWDPSPTAEAATAPAEPLPAEDESDPEDVRETVLKVLASLKEPKPKVLAANLEPSLATSYDEPDAASDTPEERLVEPPIELGMELRPGEFDPPTHLSKTAIELPTLTPLDAADASALEAEFQIAPAASEASVVEVSPEADGREEASDPEDVRETVLKVLASLDDPSRSPGAAWVRNAEVLDAAASEETDDATLAAPQQKPEPEPEFPEISEESLENAPEEKSPRGVLTAGLKRLGSLLPFRK